MKQYIEAELELIEFAAEDVITASGDPDLYEGPSVNPWP